jgi:hypothetical protein
MPPLLGPGGSGSMAKNPSTRWFFNDWANEPGLRLCSVSARGLWMDMLCIAAASDRQGYVEIDGKPCSVNDLARYSNAPPANIRRWLKELENHGVFSRDDDGVIFNRRMVREAESVIHKGRARKPSDPQRTAHEHRTNQGELPLKNGHDDSPAGRATQDTEGVPQDPDSEFNKTSSSETPTVGPEGEKNHLGESSKRAARALDGDPTGPPPLHAEVAELVERRVENPGVGGSTRSLGTIATGLCSRITGPPACRSKASAKKPDFVRYELLPQMQRRVLAAARQLDLVWGHQEMTQLDPLTKRPIDPVAFQRAIDGTAKLIKLNGWLDPAAPVLRDWKQQHGIAA